MMRKLDIAVAGCGPAGLAAAAMLARDGHKVTIFERFDTPQPIGSGLLIQPTGLAILSVLGLAGRASSMGHRVDRLHGMAGGRTVLDVPYGALGGEGAFGLGIHRAALFDLLFEVALEAGAVIVSGREVSGSEFASSGRRLLFRNGASEGPFDLIIDALGSSSPLATGERRPLAFGALWATVAWPEAEPSSAALRQRYRRASVMAGILPIGRSSASSQPLAALFWSLRAEQLPAWQERGVQAWRDEWLALWPQTSAFVEKVEARDFQFARYAHRTARQPAAEAMIHIGDSWHSTSPQLGQGANMALLDAYALAKALQDANCVADALARAVAMRTRHVRIYQILSLLLTPVYQSDGRVVPAIRDRLVGPLSSIWPIPQIQAAMVAGLIGRPLHRLGLDG